MKFKIYSRKSVYTGKGESVENQVEMCRAYVFANYPGTAEEDITVYEDEGFSGKSLDRPRFQQMLRDIELEKPDCVVCYRLDRISRNVGDFAGLIEYLNRREIAFVCIREKFDTGTPMGKAMMYIASVFAQLERETIAERVRDNMLLLAKTGRWLGGQTPTGFTSEKVQEVVVDGRVKTACKLKVNEEEMAAVRLIYERMLSLRSVSAVRKELAARNIRSRAGKDYSLPGLKEILQNPVYCAADREALAYFRAGGAVVCFGEEDLGGRRGLLAYNKRDYTKTHAPRQPMDRWIVAAGKHRGQIPGKDWVRVQRIFEENREEGGPEAAAHNAYALLSGRIYCTRCGSRMFAKRRSNNPEVFDYICADKLQFSRCGCPNLNGPRTDALVWGYLAEFEPPPERLRRGLEGLRKELRGGPADDPEALIEKRIRSCGEEMARLVELLAAEAVSPAILRRVNDRAAELDAEMGELVRKRDALARDGEGRERPEIVPASLRDSFARAPVHEKRALIRLLLQKCQWNGRELDIFLYRP